MSLLFSLNILLFTGISITAGKNVDTQLLFTQNNVKFSTDIYIILTKSDSMKNFVISPFSIQTCGAMLYSGAGGKTAEDMVKGLKLETDDKQRIGQVFRSILEEHSTESVEIANKIYLAEDVKVKPEFQQTVKEEFFSDEENIDFTNGEKTAKIINNWVKGATHNKIKELVKQYTLEKDTAVFMANAVYFKGLWKIPFTDNFERIFVTSENRDKKVHMMSVLGEFKYREIDELDAKILELEYDNTDVSMVLILPNKVNGLQKLEKKLSEIDLLRITENLSKTQVDFSLPKFTIEYSTDLRQLFTEIGMGSMFSNRADFSNMIFGENVEINKAIHKAIIEVNERGTEAGAITGFGARPTAIYPEFTADHPFMFLIKSRSAVLFMGRFVE